MGKRRKGGGRNTIRNYSICASRIRVVGGFGAGGSGDCFGRLGGGDGVRVAAWKFAGRSIMSLMNPQTQIKSWKLSAVNECDTRFRNNAKVRCITSVYTSASLLFPNRGRRGPKTNYRLSRSQYAYEGLPCITLRLLHTGKNFSFPGWHLVSSSRGGKSNVLVRSATALPCFVNPEQINWTVGRDDTTIPPTLVHSRFSFFGNRFVETLRFVKFPFLPPSFNSKLR